MFNMADAGSPDVGGSRTVSRRDFLKLAGLGLAGAYVANRTGAVDYVSSLFDPESKKVLTPETVSGIEVYGLGEEIRTGYHVDLLYDNFDKKFDAKLTPELQEKSRFEQREALLDKNKRHLEIVVSKRAYNSFLDRREETGVDFVEWIQMSVDLMNRTTETAKPKVDITTQLLRVVVVGDEFKKNPSKHSKDMDATRFIQEDYRDKEKLGSYFFGVYENENGDVEIRKPDGFDHWDSRKFIFARGNDSLTGKDNILIDFGEIHEWYHMCYDVPDEYYMDTNNSPFKQPTFRFETGNFVEPSLSPYISLMIKYNIDTGRRGAFVDPDQKLFAEDYKNYCLNQFPEHSTISTNNIDKKISVYFPKLKDGHNDYDQPFGYGGENGEVTIKDDQMRVRGGDIDWPLGSAIIRSGEKEIYVPTAVFNMSKVSGVDPANYHINFEDHPYNINSKTQIAKLVDSSDLTKFRQEMEGAGKQVFAKMKIPGTQTWCFWFLEE